MFSDFCRSINTWSGPIFTTCAGIGAGAFVEAYRSLSSNCDENTRLTTILLLTIGAAGSVFCAIKGRTRIEFYDDMTDEQYQLTSTSTSMVGVEPVVRILSTYGCGLSFGGGVVAVFVENLKRCPASHFTYPYAIIGVGGGFILMNVFLNEKVRRLKNRCIQIVPVSSVRPSSVVDYGRSGYTVGADDVELQIREKNELK